MSLDMPEVGICSITMPMFIAAVLEDVELGFSMEFSKLRRSISSDWAIIPRAVSKIKDLVTNIKETNKSTGIEGIDGTRADISTGRVCNFHDIDVGYFSKNAVTNVISC